MMQQHWMREEATEGKKRNALVRGKILQTWLPLFRLRNEMRHHKFCLKWNRLIWICWPGMLCVFLGRASDSVRSTTTRTPHYINEIPHTSWRALAKLGKSYKHKSRALLPLLTQSLFYLKGNTRCAFNNYVWIRAWGAGRFIIISYVRYTVATLISGSPLWAHFQKHSLIKQLVGDAELTPHLRCSAFAGRL